LTTLRSASSYGTLVFQSLESSPTTNSSPIHTCTSATSTSPSTTHETVFSRNSAAPLPSFDAQIPLRRTQRHIFDIILGLSLEDLALREADTITGTVIRVTS
jgi:hypothetical protein